MKTLFAAIAIIIMTGISLPAEAGQCPRDMKLIDAALPGANLSSSQMALVKKLRMEGETLHKSGGHSASVKTLAKAKKILGIM